MPEAQIDNPLGAFPVSGSTAVQSVRLGEVVIPFKASTTIAALAAVSIATATFTVATAATDGTAALTRGIALNACTAGQTCMVQVRGLVRNIPVAGAVADGDTLKRSVTTAGKLSATASPATGEVFGVALAASAANVVDVWVTK